MDSKPFSPPRVGGIVSNAKPTVIMATPPEQVEVSVHAPHEMYPISPTNEDAVYIDRDRPRWLQRDKPDGGDPAECGI